ncbi:MAG: hypothetical protein AAB337_00350 [Patescibacteria group bacterium]
MIDLSAGIPLAILLIPYGLFVLLYLFFVSFNLYHLWHYGTADWKTKTIIFCYIAGTVLIAYASFVALSGYNWMTPIDLQEIFSSITSKSLPSL